MVRMVSRIRWVERTFEFNLPVGVFPCILERLRGTPARIREIVEPLSNDMRTTRVEQAWSIQEHVGHLFDLESVHEGRLDDYLNAAAVLRPADKQNRKTHEARHNETPIEELLDAFAAARMRFVRRLETFDEAILSRSALHPRLNVPMRMMDMGLFVAEHDDHHLAAITALLGRRA